MTGFARAVLALLAAALGACTFLPWVGGVSAWSLDIRSMFAVPAASGVQPWTSIGGLVAVAALLVLVGAALGSRAAVIIGSLLAIAVPSVWVFGNAVSDANGAVTLARVQIGAFATALLGFLTLVLVAAARDASSSSLR